MFKNNAEETGVKPGNEARKGPGEGAGTTGKGKPLAEGKGKTEARAASASRIASAARATRATRAVASEKIIAILPAFNEEVAIGSVVLLARKYAGRVLVIDDGSSDSTSEVAKLAGAEVIRHEINQGKGGALKTGFEAALEADPLPLAIVTLDSDGQHNPAEIPVLAAPILSGEADMVIGSRYLNGHATDTPAYRRVGQTVLDTATNFNSHLHITDSQSGFRAYSPAVKKVFRFCANGMAIESEMLADAGAAGLRIKEVEIGVRYDVDCSTENPLKHGLTVLVRILKDMEHNRPLYYFTLPGMVLGTTGLYMGLDFLQDFYHGGGLNFGPTMLMLGLTIVGTFMAFTGIILHSMANFMREFKSV